MLSPFDISKNILQKTPRLDDATISSDLEPWMINMIFSNDINMSLMANAMNREGISKKMLYDFYYYGIPKTKRFIPYNSKKEKLDKEIRYLMEYFGCSQDVAKDYVVLISDEEKAEIVSYFEDRGKKK